MGVSWRGFLPFPYTPHPPSASTSSQTLLIEIPRGGPTIEASRLKWMLRLNNGDSRDITWESLCQCVPMRVPWILNFVNILLISGISLSSLVRLILYKIWSVCGERGRKIVVCNTRYDRLYGLVIKRSRVRFPALPHFSGLERGPLCVVRITENQRYNIIRSGGDFK